MYQVEFATSDKVDDLKAKWGSYNDLPVGWRPSDQVTVMSRLAHCAPMYMESRQMIYNAFHDVKNPLPLVQGMLYFYRDNYGVAIVHKWVDNVIRYEYYEFGCKHKYEEIPHGKYFRNDQTRNFKCSKCQDSYVIDSSD